MNRAYSLLEVRGVDDDARELTGIASTPETDRQGDVIEPAGARIKLPTPLLWQHSHADPIGNVTAAEVRSDGIHVTARLAPAGVDATVDRAWSLIKSGLVRGLSIGFRILDGGAEPLDKAKPHKGYRIHAWELLELSAVTIPANAGAAITTVKQLKEHAMSAPAAEPQGKLQSIDTMRQQAPAIMKASKRPYSLVRALAYSAGIDGVDAGLEREYSQECQRRQSWRSFKGLAVPLNAIMQTKATHSTGDASGQPLTFEDRRMDLFAKVPNALRVATVAGKIGVRFLDTPEEKLSYPVQTEKLNLAWHAKDAAAGDGGQGQFALKEIVPKYAGLKFDIERSALKFAAHPDVEDLLLADAREAVTSGIDNAIMLGAGTAVEPQGIFRHPGIPTATGIGLTPTVGQFHRIVNDLNEFDGDTGSLRWLLHPDTVASLMQTPRYPGNEDPVLWYDNPELGGAFHFMSHKVPKRGVNDADAAVGRFSEILACTFGGALDLNVNPYSQTHFERGAVLVVGLIDFNTAIRDATRLRIYTDAPAMG